MQCLYSHIYHMTRYTPRTRPQKNCMVSHAFNSKMKRQKQAYFYEFNTSLINLSSSKPVRNTLQNYVLKQKNKTRNVHSRIIHKP